MLHLYALAEHPVRLPESEQVGGIALTAIEVDRVVDLRGRLTLPRRQEGGRD